MARAFRKGQSVAFGGEGLDSKNFETEQYRDHAANRCIDP
ncbi:hypothetical protein FHT78_004267 [Rhizobium sp. BK196]|jgi:hypothetical protein|nr:hypothetical protein [Rhizobium sp. BK196]